MDLEPNQLRLVANTIRGLAMDAVQKANSGHPGMPMGMADVAACLWLEHLRYSPADPHWAGRDRFVLSAGHGSMLLYALLHLAGYPLSLDDLRNFRQLHSKTPGHPEYGETEGVETTTGPLGQGFATGVGMALAARMTAQRFADPNLESRVFGIVSDGDLMEGISSEAASLAGHLGLSNLVYLYDDNRITIEGHTDLAFSEDVAKRFQAMGWRVWRIDGHDPDQIRGALRAATREKKRPSMVVCRTHIAYGSPNKVDSHEAHGAPLGPEEVALTKQALGLPQDAFHVPDAVRALFHARAETNEALRARWLRARKRWAKQDAERAERYAACVERRVPADILDQLMHAVGSQADATRNLSGKAIQRAAELVPALLGGSADLDPSTKTRIKASTSVTATDLSGRVLHFGIREHAMAAILNGMALHGACLPMGSTFLVFADYARPAIRLAALMRLPVTFVFTHDSLMVGEDGPTHQPVEHVAALRLIPNLHVVRPADGPEVAAAWTHALTRRDGPSALILTRQNLPALDRPAGFTPADLLRGAHVVHEPAGPPQAVVIATGAEVGTTVAAARLLSARGHALRVISMPCVEVFVQQDAAYRQRILPPGVPVLAVEMGRPEIWCAFTGSLARVVGQATFGASAPMKALAEHFGFTPDKVAERLERALVAG